MSLGVATISYLDANSNHKSVHSVIDHASVTSRHLYVFYFVPVWGTLQAASGLYSPTIGVLMHTKADPYDASLVGKGSDESLKFFETVLGGHDSTSARQETQSLYKLYPCACIATTKRPVYAWSLSSCSWYVLCLLLE